MEKSIFARIGLLTHEDKVELEDQLGEIREILQTDSIYQKKRIDELVLNVQQVEERLVGIGEAMCRLEDAIIAMNQLISDSASNTANLIDSLFDGNSKEMKQLKQSSKNNNKLLQAIDASKATKDDVEIISSFLRFIAANQLIHEVQSSVSMSANEDSLDSKKLLEKLQKI